MYGIGLADARRAVYIWTNAAEQWGQHVLDVLQQRVKTPNPEQDVYDAAKYAAHFGNRVLRFSDPFDNPPTNC